MDPLREVGEVTMIRRPNLSTGPASVDQARLRTDGRADFWCWLACWAMVEVGGVSGSLRGTMAAGVFALTMACAASGSLDCQHEAGDGRQERERTAAPRLERSARTWESWRLSIMLACARALAEDGVMRGLLAASASASDGCLVRVERWADARGVGNAEAK